MSVLAAYSDQLCFILISLSTTPDLHCCPYSSGTWLTSWDGSTLQTAAGAGQLCPYDQTDWDNDERPYCGRLCITVKEKLF